MKPFTENLSRGRPLQSPQHTRTTNFSGTEQVGKLQREDASLESMFKKGESVEAVEHDNSVTSFVVQEGLLYRRVRSK